MNIRGVHEPDYRYVGYFPTVGLTKIIQLWKNQTVAEQCPIWSLKCYSDKGRRSNRRRVHEYLEVEDLEGKAVRLEYDARVHKPLNIDELLSALGNEGIRSVPIDQLVVAIPKDLVTPKRTVKSGLERDQFCAIFDNSGPIPEDDKRRDDVIKHTKEEAEELGFKYSCLDLSKLQDSHVWAKGGRDRYDVSQDIRTTRLVIRAIDVGATLGLWAQYKRTKRDTWVYASGGRIT